MRFVATVIGPNPGAVTEDLLWELRRTLDGLGARASAPEWLALGEAADLFFHELDPDQADAAIRRAIAGEPLDCVAQPAAGRRKRLLIADMESTIIQQEMLDEIAALKGIKPQVADITARAMNGELDFIDALKERVALLAGLLETEIEALANVIRLTPGAAELVATMGLNGARTVLVSGGFTIFADKIAAILGFDVVSANVLEFDVAQGVRQLTGRVRPPIRDRNDKLKMLIEQSAASRIQLSETLAVGDGANDLPMLLAAGLGIAFHAKPSVRQSVRARIDHASLKALLFVQGYKAAEIVTN